MLEYLLQYTLIAIYGVFGLLFLTSVYNWITGSFRHLIRIQVITFGIFNLLTLIFGTILRYHYGEISLESIRKLLSEFSATETDADLQFWIFFFLLNWDSVILIFMILFFTFRKSEIMEPDTPEAVKEFAFVIVCHNSSDKIAKTIGSIKDRYHMFDQNWTYNIFISDNGSSSEEQEKTRYIAHRMGCQYLHLKIGSKTLSQFATANYIRKYYPDIKYMVSLDDDILLPKTWNFAHVRSHFQDNVCILAFPLIAGNRINYLTECQNFEYLLAGYTKIIQSDLGSCLFGSGGFTVYNLDYFLEIVTYHTTAFRGEDLQLGLICHSTVPNSPRIGNEKLFPNPKIACCSEIFIATEVPHHLWHWNSCSCGEPSLCRQRIGSWEITRHRFIGKFFHLLTVPSFTWNAIMIKLCVLYEMVQVLNDWIIIFYILIISIFYNGLVNILRTTCVSLIWNIPLLLLMNWFFRIPSFVVLSYNLYYKFFYNWIIRIGSLFYNVGYYWPNYTEPPSILDQYNSNSGLRRELNEYWSVKIEIPEVDLEELEII